MIRVPWPEYISLKRWAAEIVCRYPDEPLPILTDENEWEPWGMIVCNTGVFKDANIPGPFLIKHGKRQKPFKDWREWGKVVYKIMAIEPERQ